MEINWISSSAFSKIKCVVQSENDQFSHSFFLMTDSNKTLQSSREIANLLSKNFKRVLRQNDNLGLSNFTAHVNSFIKKCMQFEGNQIEFHLVQNLSILQYFIRTESASIISQKKRKKKKRWTRQCTKNNFMKTSIQLHRWHCCPPQWDAQQKRKPAKPIEDSTSYEPISRLLC